MDLSRLNPEQRAAVVYIGNALRIVAGPGTGKTETLSSRIAYMIKEMNIAPTSILAMTFTNKAANEMKKRVAKLSGLLPSQINSGTFHSCALKFLRLFSEHSGASKDITVIDQRESQSIMRIIASDMLLDRLEADSIKSTIERWKNDGLDYHDVEDTNKYDRNALFVYKNYTKYCRENNKCDFGDLLILFYKALRLKPPFKEVMNERFHHILIDEFQDTNTIQMKIVKLLAPTNSKEHTITIVGDDYQAIHGWRGAKVDNMIFFDRHYPECHTINLIINYRSTKTIVEASGHVIKNNSRQLFKELKALSTEEHPISLYRVENEDDEADLIAKLIKSQPDGFGDTAILYRTNAQSRPFEDKLRRAMIPFEMKGSLSFYQRKEIKDMMAYFRLIVNPESNEDFKRIINVPSRKIGKKTLDGIIKTSEEKGTTYLEACNDASHKGAKEFASLIRKLKEMNDDGKTPYELLEQLLEDTKYLERLSASLENNVSEESMERVENVNELSALLQEYSYLNEDASLAGFLNEVCLGELHIDEKSENTEQNPQQNKVQLMTFHTSKGLEFKHVYIVGACEEIIPHMYSSSGEGLEEERRLFYVAMTRSKRNLTISSLKMKQHFGGVKQLVPSRFIKEIPKQFVNYIKKI